MEVLEVRELPWGREEVIFGGDSVRVKFIAVRAGQRCSLQRHARRTERWTVLSKDGGTLRIGDDEVPAAHGAMFTVPAGTLHRFAAPQSGELKLFEVWSGECDQDDIERLGDDYGRV